MVVKSFEKYIYLEKNNSIPYILILTNITGSFLIVLISSSFSILITCAATVYPLVVHIETHRDQSSDLQQA